MEFEKIFKTKILDSKKQFDYKFTFIHFEIGGW